MPAAWATPGEVPALWHQFRQPVEIAHCDLGSIGCRILFPLEFIVPSHFVNLGSPYSASDNIDDSLKKVHCQSFDKHEDDGVGVEIVQEEPGHAEPVAAFLVF